MRWRCSIAWLSPLHAARGAVLLVVMGLGQGTSLATERIAGLYQHVGPIAATLQVAKDTDHYLVRLEGGVPHGQGAATPADCVVEARGVLDGPVLFASFGPVETETFSYGAAQAEREARTVEITFETDSAEVVEADVFGYCGLGADFSGRYRKVE